MQVTGSVVCDSGGGSASLCPAPVTARPSAGQHLPLLSVAVSQGHGSVRQPRLVQHTPVQISVHRAAGQTSSRAGRAEWDSAWSVGGEKVASGAAQHMEQFQECRQLREW